MSVVGIAGWDPIDRDDPATAYVLDEGAHHVRESRDAAADASSNEVLLSWLVDQPQDALVHHVGKALGEEALVSAAESAEAASEMWLASCRWAAAAHVVLYSKGMTAAAEILKKAADTLLKVELGARASPQAVRQKDELEMAVVNDLCMYNPNSLDAMAPRMQAILTTECGKAHPAECFAMTMMSQVIPPWMAGDWEAFPPAITDVVSFIVAAGCEGSPDPGTRDLCCVLLMIPCSWMFENSLLSEGFTWDTFGEGGKHLLRCVDVYDCKITSNPENIRSHFLL